MHVDQPKLNVPDMDLVKDDGLLSRLQFMMSDDVSSEPPTPPEPDDFFEDSSSE